MFIPSWCKREQQRHIRVSALGPSGIFHNDATTDVDFVAERSDSVGVAAGEAHAEQGTGGGRVGEGEGEVAKSGEFGQVVRDEREVAEGAGEVAGEGVEDAGGVEGGLVVGGCGRCGF